MIRLRLQDFAAMVRLRLQDFAAMVRLRPSSFCVLVRLSPAPPPCPTKPCPPAVALLCPSVASGEGGAKAGRSRVSRSPAGRARIVLLCALMVIAGLIIFPRVALADPHAVFYTDRGQAQVFYNVLAALNQADYVEPPYQQDIHQDGLVPPTAQKEPPTIYSDEALGDFLSTGAYHVRPVANRSVEVASDGSVQVSPPVLEPNVENERSELPRLRVRAVTSDDGDVFFRERLQRRALAEQMRVEFAQFNCHLLHLIRGPKNTGGCDIETGEVAAAADLLIF